MNLKQRAIRLLLPEEFKQPFTVAVDASNQFSQFTKGLDLGELKSQVKPIFESFQGNSDASTAIKSILNEIATNPNYDLTRFEPANLKSTIEQEIAAIKAGRTPTAAPTPSAPATPSTPTTSTTSAAPATPAVPLSDQDFIATMTPTETWDHFKAEGLLPDSFAQILTDNPKLGEALHNAMVKDDTVLPGIIDLASRPDDAAGLNLASLEEVFNPSNPSIVNGLKKTVAVNLLTTTLNKIADEPNVKFQYLVDYGDKIKELASLDRHALLDQMQNRPGEFASYMMGVLGLEGMDGALQIQGLIQMMAPFLSMYVDMDNGFFSQYIDLGKKVLDKATDVATTYNSNPKSIAEDSYVKSYPFDEQEFTAAMEKSLEKDPTILLNETSYVKALATINSETTQEIDLVVRNMDSDPELKTAVNKLMTAGDINAASENLYDVEKFMMMGANPKEAFVLVTEGKDLHEFSLEKQQEMKDAVEQAHQNEMDLPATVANHGTNLDQYEADFAASLETKINAGVNPVTALTSTFKELNDIKNGTAAASMDDELVTLKNDETFTSYFKRLTEITPAASLTQKFAEEAREMQEEMQNSQTLDQSLKMTMDF